MIELVMTKTNLESLERQRRNIEVRSKLSRLPHKKTLQEFNVLFQPSIDEKFVKELVTMAFVYRAENIVLLGPPGAGNYGKLLLM
ncbi:ATP-binding protein [Acetomicrobium sp.]|jgi:DNA replication protein DnaC|uniref:ATP-binding protein n=1 Tax=Acetomicrobium sp. TaxID=1872099 RepID=UPI002FC7FD3F